VVPVSIWVAVMAAFFMGLAEVAYSASLPARFGLPERFSYDGRIMGKHSEVESRTSIETCRTTGSNKDIVWMGVRPNPG
jgi:hypothetical protein